jgi:DNA-binding CsgD family transcriptional regulator
VLLNVKNSAAAPSLGIIKDSVFDVIDANQDIDHLWDILFSYCHNGGFKEFTYFHLAPIGAQDFDSKFLAYRGPDSSIISAHKNTLFETGRSFVFRIRKLSRPHSFQELIHSEILSEEQMASFQDLYCNGQNSGLVIPAHGPHGRSGCFILKTNNQREFSKAETREIQWVTQACHRSYSNLRDETRKQFKSLTAREQQILTWVARGKNNSVIADIIGISQHTVNGYLRSIYLKTGTSDRTTAALRGVGEGLIDF